MLNKYLPQQFEKKWVDQWDKEKVYQTPLVQREKSVKSVKSKVYCLPMFPYPSGAGLHVGHVRIYTGCDILARYFRMKGHDVLHPIGWDAFGLPAENAAIKAQKNPADMVAVNIVNFRRQMKDLGLSYDWGKELTTSDPAYYQWTQWLFIQFFKRGLLYKKTVPIHFCPSCKTGLAEEEVLSNGTHERCGSAITKKELPQWIFRITAYADRLLNDLDRLDWPEGILQMQKNWIGKKEGIVIRYKVVGSVSQQPQFVDEIECFTTRPETNFGATFVVLSPEHKFVQKEINPDSIEVKNTNKKSNIETRLMEIKAYVKAASNKTEIERIAEGGKKTGVFTGFYAVNNLNGRLMPIWVSDFVLTSVGTGAVVGVPGHDRRDFEFAKEFGLDITRVVVAGDGDTSVITRKEQVQEREGTMVNSDFLNGMDIHQAKKKMMDYLKGQGWGKRTVSYHLRDWIFSRQRYWGEPIPMIYCEACAKKKISYWDNEKLKLKIDSSLYGWFPVSDKDLPVKLPYVKSYQPTDTGASPLSKINNFLKTNCSYCGEEARRETDTMPNWAGSCWYFIRFAQDQKKDSILADSLSQQPQKIQHATFFGSPRSSPPAFSIDNSPWLPVDWYFGGAEQAVLHLLYARFWVKALYDAGLLDFDEPFLKLRNVGIVLAQDHRKMSKSWGNVINPDEVVAHYGADSLRIHEMFMGPFDNEVIWSGQALQGSYRFLTRIWQIYHNFDKLTNDKNDEDNNLIVELQKLIQKVSNDITNVKFNTAISGMMEFLNKWEAKSEIRNPKSQTNSKFKIQNSKLSKNNAKKFLQILAPFAPFMTEEIWRTIFGEKNSIHLSSWPEVDQTVVADQNVIIPVQINGKLRATIEISASQTSQDTVVKKALENEKVKTYIDGKEYKVIYVKEKVLNFVI